MKFRSRPSIIEAFQWNGKPHDIPEPFRHHRDIDVPLPWESDLSLCIQTLEGRIRAQVGDWVVQGLKGEIYAIKPDIFAMRYDPVEE